MKKVLIVIPVLVFIATAIFLNYFYNHPNMFAPKEIKCKTDNDCSFAPIRCCPGCEGYGAFNREYAFILSKKFSECSKNCPDVVCYSPMGFTIIPAVACIDEVCTKIEQVRCTAICEYNNNWERDILSREHLEKTSLYLNITISEMVSICNCTKK